MPRKLSSEGIRNPRENTIGPNLRHLMDVWWKEKHGKKLTDEELGKAIQVSFRTIQHWRQGRVPDSTSRLKLCDFFHITEAQLFSKDLSLTLSADKEKMAIHQLLVALGMENVDPEAIARLPENKKNLIKEFINAMLGQANPGVQDPDPPPPAPNPGGSMDSHKKILIVEDDPEISHQHQVFLTENGYRVFTAGDGREAFRQIEKHKPDLILLDLMVASGMDGVKFLETFRQKDKTTKVIVLTAYPKQMSEVEAKGLQNEGFIEKPATVEYVLEQVEKAIGGPT
jgi:CheY-like chemotaxis protein/transcriptional regulator with XRE-family HTH domain